MRVGRAACPCYHVFNYKVPTIFRAESCSYHYHLIVTIHWFIKSRSSVRCSGGSAVQQATASSIIVTTPVSSGTGVTSYSRLGDRTVT